MKGKRKEFRCRSSCLRARSWSEPRKGRLVAKGHGVVNQGFDARRRQITSHVLTTCGAHREQMVDVTRVAQWWHEGTGRQMFEVESAEFAPPCGIACQAW